jgi:hypothetical protein
MARQHAAAAEIINFVIVFIFPFVLYFSFADCRWLPCELARHFSLEKAGSP